MSDLCCWISFDNLFYRYLKKVTRSFNCLNIILSEMKFWWFSFVVFKLLFFRSNLRRLLFNNLFWSCNWRFLFHNLFWSYSWRLFFFLLIFNWWLLLLNLLTINYQRFFSDFFNRNRFFILLLLNYSFGWFLPKTPTFRFLKLILNNFCFWFFS
jgi:hypothetical protein